MSDRRVVITGIGAVTPFGVGVKKLWNNVIAGNSAAVPITSVDVSKLPTRFAAQLQLEEDDLDTLV